MRKFPSQKNVNVVTGGPGGGKTTALDLFQRELRSAVKTVPEAATMLFGNGFDRGARNEDGKLLQRSISIMQISLEEISVITALSMGSRAGLTMNEVSSTALVRPSMWK